MNGLRVFAGNVAVGDVLIQPYDGSRGVVIEVVRLTATCGAPIDPDHIGIRIACDDGVSNPVFHIFDIVTVAS